MSETIKFGTCIVDYDRLVAARDSLKAKGRDIGPVRHADARPHPRQPNVTISGYAIRLPGWSQDAVFSCNERGEMWADNYSDYYDERQIGEDGERIPGTGRVHPEVAAGHKRVGDDGRWGNIEELDYLVQEYAEVGLQPIMSQLAATEVSRERDPMTGKVRILLEVPEAM